MSGKPNVVLVLTDDQGYGDLGCTGNSIVQSPQIDSFYEESVHFTNYHVGPTCAPTRAGLLTGRYANSTGVWHTIGGRSLLRKDEWTLASALGEAGYATGIFGKWHLGDSYPYRPQDRGFETTVVHGGGGISQTPDFWGNDYFDDTYFVNGIPQKFEGYCTDVFFEEALQFIERHSEDSFFCYLACNAPHGPYNVDDKYAGLYRNDVPEQRARFYGMITNIDENFGRLRRKLKELEIEDNTILIFMTDNGTSGGAKTDQDGYVVEGYNAGLRGLKNSPYDGGHRVPFFIHWPSGCLQTPLDIDQITANIDFMPTILDLCGVADTNTHSFHGKSLKPLLYAETTQWSERALVTDSQRLTNPVKWRRSAVMTDRWRLVNGSELYDMSVEREQKTNVAHSHADVVERLRTHYEEWWQIVSQQFDEEIPISIGGGVENVLTCHDWRNSHCTVPHHQGLIRQGVEENGYWEIEVVESGTYVFELRRWPREADRELVRGIEGEDIEWKREFIHPNNWNYYSGGEALDIRRAILQIGDLELSKEITGDNKAAVFEVFLEKGQMHLQTYFTNDMNLVVGAYYVYVSPIECNKS